MHSPHPQRQQPKKRPHKKGAHPLTHFRTFRSTQFIPRPLEDVFAFFADARNLEAITPPWLRFRVLTPGPIHLATNTEILYQIHWRGIPMRWTTQIRRWNPPHGFADAQLSGPYRLWHHTHRFRPERDGTRMFDTVRYALPFGPLGRIIDALQTRHDVERIFAYRTARIEAHFPPV